MWGQEWRRVARKIFPQFATRVRQPLPHTDHGGYFSDCAQNWLHISWHIQTIYCMAGNAGFYEKRRIGGGGHAGNLADSAQSLRLFKLARTGPRVRQVRRACTTYEIRSLRGWELISVGADGSLFKITQPQLFETSSAMNPSMPVQPDY